MILPDHPVGRKPRDQTPLQSPCKALQAGVWVFSWAVGTEKRLAASEALSGGRADGGLEVLCGQFQNVAFVVFAHAQQWAFGDAARRVAVVVGGGVDPV